MKRAQDILIFQNLFLLLVSIVIVGCSPTPTVQPTATQPIAPTKAPQEVVLTMGAWRTSTERMNRILDSFHDSHPYITIRFDPTHGIGWQDPAGWIVYFGLDGSDMLQKLQMYDAIVKDLQSRNVTPEFISVEFLHAPYYRMER